MIVTQSRLNDWMDHVYRDTVSRIHQSVRSYDLRFIYHIAVTFYVKMCDYVDYLNQKSSFCFSSKSTEILVQPEVDKNIRIKITVDKNVYVIDNSLKWMYFVLFYVHRKHDIQKFLTQTFVFCRINLYKNVHVSQSLRYMNQTASFIIFCIFIYLQRLLYHDGIRFNVI